MKLFKNRKKVAVVVEKVKPEPVGAIYIVHVNTHDLLLVLAFPPVQIPMRDQRV